MKIFGLIIVFIYWKEIFVCFFNILKYLKVTQISDILEIFFFAFDITIRFVKA